MEKTRQLVLEKLNQVATQSDKGWVKDLEERATADKEVHNRLTHRCGYVGISGVYSVTSMSSSVIMLLINSFVKAMGEELLEQGILPWLDDMGTATGITMARPA